MEKRAYLTCRTHDCNPGIQPYAPSDEHTDIRLRPNSTHTSRTTNILAFAVGCTRVETRTRHPSYKDPAASAYKQSPIALYPEGALGVVSAVGSFGVMATCAVVDIAMGRGDSP
jgi:hypothetical protein